MYLLYAPPKKFGLIPPGQPLLADEVKFFKNVAYCPKYFWFRHHVINGCRDITPKLLKRLNQKRDLVNIVIIATGGIGDSIWIMPFTRYMKERYPKSKIVVITEKKNVGVWRNVPYVDSFAENVIWNVQGLLRWADDVFDFGGMATFLKKEMRLDPVEATFRMAGYPLPKEKKLCRPWMILTQDEGKKAESILKQNNMDPRGDKFVTIGIEASTPNRNWPLTYAVQLSQSLVKDNIKVVWLGTSPNYTAEFLDAATNKIGVVNLVKKTNVREAAAIICLSNLYIGPNSGLMALAASFEIPTIGLFGAFNPKVRAKFYDRFRALWGKTNCAPCDEHWTECRYGYPAPCMKMISAAEVYFAAQEMMKRYPRPVILKSPID